MANRRQLTMPFGSKSQLNQMYSTLIPRLWLILYQLFKF